MSIIDEFELQNQRPIVNELAAERAKVVELEATCKRLEDGIPRLIEDYYLCRKQRDQLAGLLREISSGLSCENLHHKKSEQHDFDEPCKVLARIDAALSELPK